MKVYSSIWRALLVGVCAALLAAAPLPAQTADTTAALAPGSFAVGFGSAVIQDSTRRLASGEQRPIPIAVWYPAISNPGRPMSYRDYFQVFDSPRTAGTDSAELKAFTDFIASHGAPRAEVLAWLASIAEQLDLSLADAASRYANGCPRCGAVPCDCPM